MSVTTISIDAIGLSVRSVNALHRIEVHTVGDMLLYDEERLYQVRNLGKKSVQEILAKIEEYRAWEASGQMPPDPEQAQPQEDPQGWMESEAGKDQVLRWLRDRQVRIDVLELLSAKAYNILALNDFEYLHQIAFQTREDLMQIHRMDESCAGEIFLQADAYIRDQLAAIYAEANTRDTDKPITLSQMRFLPEHRENILTFVLKNDISVDSLPLSTRPKNQLQKNGYQKLSDILFLTQDEIRRLPAMGSRSVDQIMDAIEGYLHQHEARILAFCSGDASVLWDDTALRKKILRLYVEAPFLGFSLQEIAGKLDLPENFSQDRIKKVLGTMLAEGLLEYVDFRCYRIYQQFAPFLDACDALDPRSKRILQLRLQGNTLEEIGVEYGVSRERIRQIIKKKAGEVRGRYTLVTGDQWFDEDYYWYFYENYSFDRREVSAWLGIPESVWQYLDMMDVKQGKQDLEVALEDHAHLETGLRLKIKNYLNRNKVFVDGVWVERRRSELEPIVARKFCRDDLTFDMYAKVFNDFLETEEIPFDEDLYYTDTVIRTRKARLAEARFILWKQNETLRYYDIDSRDYTELLETLKMDVHENVEYSTMKFMREYPALMEKYDIRDQYELHNLLRKIVPEGSYHDFHCGRMPEIKFGTFDRDAAILDILIEMAPVTVQDLSQRISEEYGYDTMVVWANYLQPFSVYYHDGFYSVDQKAMPTDRMAALKQVLPNDFYYIEEIRKIYSDLYPDADPEEVNPYNLKSMGFLVLSRYVLQHYPSLDAYCEDILTREDIVDLRQHRRRLNYVGMFYQKLLELKRNLDIIEFEPGQVLHFRKLARAGITKEDLRLFCDAVYEYLPEGSYFTIRSLQKDGFASDLFDLGFSDWFYSNLLISDLRFSYTNVYGNIVLYKGVQAITIQSFLVNRVCDHGWIDTFDLMTELTESYGCVSVDKNDIFQSLRNTQVYRDKILDRLYANVELYYRDLDEAGGF